MTMHVRIAVLTALALCAVPTAATAQYGTPPEMRMTRPTIRDAEPGAVPRAGVEVIPAAYRRQPVFYRSSEAPGTIIIDTSERFLYLIQPNNVALRYGIGVGRDGFQWNGLLQDLAQGGMAGLDAAAGDDRAAALSAALHGRRSGQSDGRARALSRQHHLSHPRHQCAGDHRPRGFIGLLPAGQRRDQDLYERVPVGTKVIVQQ